MLFTEYITNTASNDGFNPQKGKMVGCILLRGYRRLVSISTDLFLYTKT